MKRRRDGNLLLQTQVPYLYGVTASCCVLFTGNSLTLKVCKWKHVYCSINMNFLLLKNVIRKVPCRIPFVVFFLFYSLKWLDTYIHLQSMRRLFKCFVLWTEICKHEDPSTVSLLNCLCILLSHLAFQTLSLAHHYLCLITS